MRKGQFSAFFASWHRFLLRDASWLTVERMLAVARVLLLVLLVLAASIPWTVPAMQVGHDFAAFWTAAGLALEGQAAGAYGEPERAALAALFGPETYPPFFYPPVGLLIWLPFALVPFATAAALWIATSGAAYAMAVRAVAGGRSLVPAIAFPAVLVCALYGQNSLFSAALLGGAAATLNRRPLLAGALIGCLAYKPQLAMLAPLALAVAGRWHAFAAATAMVFLLIAASVAAFGMEAWVAFIATLPDASAWVANGVPGFDKFVSPYAAARLLGASEGVAWAVQAMTAIPAIGALLLVARRRPGGSAEIAMLVAATGLCLPFLFDYDCVIFAVPGAWLAFEASRTGWLPYERGMLALLYVAPVQVKLTAAAHGLPLGPVALAMLVALVVRRASSPRLRTEDPCDAAAGGLRSVPALSGAGPSA